MPTKSKKRPRAKRRTASKDAASLPFRLIGEQFSGDRIQEDHGSIVREALIESLNEQLHQIPSHYLVKVLGVLSKLAGEQAYKGKLFPPPKDLA